MLFVVVLRDGLGRFECRPLRFEIVFIGSPDDGSIGAQSPDSEEMVGSVATYDREKRESGVVNSRTCGIFFR